MTGTCAVCSVLPLVIPSPLRNQSVPVRQTLNRNAASDNREQVIDARRRSARPAAR